jgi:hypothetical protein
MVSPSFCIEISDLVAWLARSDMKVDRLGGAPNGQGAVALRFDTCSIAFDWQNRAVGQSVKPVPGVTLTRRCQLEYS